MNWLLPTRRLIPKWRKAKFALHQPDMFGLVQRGNGRATVDSADQAVDIALHTWKATNSIGDLADLLAFGLDPRRRDQLTGPARIALSMPGTTAALRLVASEIVSGGHSEDAVWISSLSARSAQGLRALLRNAPNDVLALVDLAQHHLSHGKRKPAYRALSTAYQLAPNSVHVIRAITRFWIHAGENERAHRFIKSVGRTSSDPWLMATEIAAAEVAGAPSTQLRQAQRAIAVKSFGSNNLTELAGAIGGVELSNGKLKEARKLFRMALEHPTDNVIAQAITNQKFLGIDIDEQLISKAPTGAFEGRTLQAFLAADFERASILTGSWADEEIFSSRPRLLQSYFEGALGNYKQSLEAAEIGLSADHRDLSLRGNKAYALAALGRFSEALSELSGIQAGGNDMASQNLATRGMVLLHQGRFEEGKQYYEDALTEFELAKEEAQYTDCLAFYARAAVQSTAPGSEEITKRALERYKKYFSPAAAVVLRTVNQKADVEKPAPMRKLVQWEWDKQSNVIQEKRVLTAKGAPGFVVLDRGRRR